MFSGKALRPALLCGSFLLSSCLAVLAQGGLPEAPYLVIKEPPNAKMMMLLGASTSEKALIANFGAKNVKQEKITLAEGEERPGTVIYPDKPKWRATVVWRDQKKRDGAELIIISDKPSSWRLSSGITTGTTLVELEKLNGKPFKFLGFDWDMGGNVVSWNGGKLEKELKSKSGKVSIGVQLLPPAGKETPNGLSGDKEISSSDARARKLNPVVDSLSILAP